ncbi:MAG: SDR family oxidoreductase [Lautropia sp.]
MDLGISGRRALVCAASKGLGRGCAEALAAEGVNLVMVARGAEALEATAQAIRDAHRVEVVTVAADITTPAGRAAALAACPQPDILVNNAGGQPGGDFRSFKREDWLTAVDANMVTPIELIKATVDGMIERRFGRIINITSRSVKAPLAHLPLSNGARAGLTNVLAAFARQVVPANVTINNLLPGLFDTDTYRKRNVALAKATGKPIEQIDAERLAEVPAGRLGTPDEFGRACAWLCSVHAGYVTGQNLLLDGGNYAGAL